MDIPRHFLPHPPSASVEAQDAFEGLFETALAKGRGCSIDYDLSWPRWQFVSHIVRSRSLIAHGSQRGDIEQFEPRKSADANAFGDRKAVYGASDGLWAMFYAILDRQRHPMLLVNSAARIEREDGSLGDPFYYFSISRPALKERAFSPGTVYFLPRETFEPMPPIMLGGRRVHVLQWASRVPVAPLHKLAVTSEDFPFLQDIRGHDDETALASARADPDGFPWVD